jgi:hypothetical protein
MSPDVIHEFRMRALNPKARRLGSDLINVREKSVNGASWFYDTRARRCVLPVPPTRPEPLHGPTFVVIRLRMNSAAELPTGAERISGAVFMSAL